MSGRLQILRHKSWNVWNQNNKEKVLRDERLDKELKEKKKKQQSLEAQDYILQNLRGHFGNDYTEQISKRKFISAYEEEDIERGEELALKRRKDNGIIDYTFNDVVKNDIWYLKNPDYSSCTHSNSFLSKKEEDKLKSLDPMASFLSNKNDDQAFIFDEDSKKKNSKNEKSIDNKNGPKNSSHFRSYNSYLFDRNPENFNTNNEKYRKKEVYEKSDRRNKHQKRER